MNKFSFFICQHSIYTVNVEVNVFVGMDRCVCVYIVFFLYVVCMYVEIPDLTITELLRSAIYLQYKSPDNFRRTYDVICDTFIFLC